MIVALFVDSKGVYSLFPEVACWGVERDARLYYGTDPVVAHPPCQLWVNFAALNFKRYGGEHNRPGNDGGCFEKALNTVRRNGGVLEHPAGSKAWEHFNLTKPVSGEWLNSAKNEWVCEVWQTAYGHKARKRTWLFYKGASKPAEMDWSRAPGTHQVGWFDRIKPTLSKKEASATPISFAAALIGLAKNSV